MMRVDVAVSRLRRDLAISSAIKGALLGAVVLVLVLDATGVRRPINGSMLLALIGVVWITLSYRSIKGSQASADLPLLIAAGQYDLAEEQIDTAMRSFSLFRWVKLRTVHYLALLRNAQRRWEETAILCQALLGERSGPMSGLMRSTRLLLASALLEVGDLRGVHVNLAELYNQRLPLSEALELLAIQTDYLARIEAWEPMMQGIGRKVEMAELMSGGKAARVQALLGLAAKRTGRADWAEWLRRRAELLGEASELIVQRPILAGLWKDDKEEVGAR